MPSPALVFKTADLTAEFEAIHQLNHRTFTSEIPQHEPRPDGRLVDRFHDSNLYLIAKRGDDVVGMLSVRFAPPFSLALKLPDLERHLPPDRQWCEPRLLAIAPEHRGGRILKGLLQLFLSTAAAHGTDAAMISAAVNRLPFYKALGFQPFGPLVGHDGAWFQPMFARNEDFNLAMSRRGRFRAIQPSPTPPVSLLPGPVTLLPEVHAALALPPICHRSSAFSPLFNETKLRLRLLTSAPHVTITSGPATLANDLVGAQLLLLDEPGMVLSNGEFGERLGDHARRLWLPHEHLRLPWGKPLEVSKLAALNLPRAVPPDQSSPGIITLTLPPDCPALAVADRLESLGCLVYSRSHWLRSRNWLQFCLMGALTDDDIDRVLAILSDTSLWRSA